MLDSNLNLFLHAFIDYTFQEYDVISIGASINFR